MENLNEVLNQLLKHRYEKFIIQNTSTLFVDFSSLDISNDLSNKLNQLLKYEIDCYKIEEQLAFPKLTLALNILQTAKNAIETLKKIDKNNKKLAYYESNKNASLDDLIQKFENKLLANDEDELITQSSKNELLLKLAIASLKKNNPTLLHYYLLALNLFDLSEFSLGVDESYGYEIVSNLSNFFGVGHSTQGQILKSVAIQLYQLYKNDFTNISELTNLISEIIDVYFDTKEPYKNFSKFTTRTRYLKNVINNFNIFDIDDDINTTQQNILNDFFENIFFKEMPEFDNDDFRTTLKIYLDNPIQFYIDMTRLNLFGL